MFNNFEELSAKVLDIIANHTNDIIISTDYGDSVSYEALVVKLYGKTSMPKYKTFLNSDGNVILTRGTYEEYMSKSKPKKTDDAGRKPFQLHPLPKVWDDNEYDDDDEGEDYYDDNDEIVLRKSILFVESLDSMGHYFNILFNTYLIPTDYGLIVFKGDFNSEDFFVMQSATFYPIEHGHDNDIADYFNEHFKRYESPSEKKNHYYLALNTTYGFTSKQFKFENWTCDVSKNYNDDIPYEKMKKLVGGDGKALILLYGEPGTGKSSIIKTLINDVQNKKFIYFDPNLLNGISNDKLISYMESNKNSVFIIEDCEKLLADRDKGNPFLNSMLNLTDGIIGETFKIKFVCTFNCDISKIDKAVLRKGRLSLKYEFKKLCLDKCKAIRPSSTKEMSLADLYNEEENDYSCISEPKIGFK